MLRISSLVLAFLFVSSSAWSQASWSLIGVAVAGPDAPKVLAATDKLMNSETGKTFKGQLHLQAIVADGDGAATHVFAPIYETTADREAFAQKLQGDPAWATFQKELAGVSKPVSTTLYQTVKSWGDIVDTDPVWVTHSFKVSDPAAFVAAIDALMASPTGKKFPGQVHLSAVVAGGLSPVSHIVSVGYATQVEMAAWLATRNASDDWAKYLAASQPASEFLGTVLAVDIKVWGPASLGGLTN